MPRITFQEIQNLCAEKEHESLTLEFKTCNELRPGANHPQDDIKNEISKDISSFLNSAGGRIIYGIREKNSRAEEIDGDLFSVTEKYIPEWITEIARSRIQPPPTLDVYPIALQQGDLNSRFLLVVDIQQGDQAYQSADKRYYKRVGAQPKPMEHYEVVDAMNRSKGAVLKLQLELAQDSLTEYSQHRYPFTLFAEITSTNHIASEYGSLRLTILKPIDFRGQPSRATEFIFKDIQVPGAQTINWTWGAAQGAVVYPGDWYHLQLLITLPSPVQNLRYVCLFKTELFTQNALKIEQLWIIKFPTFGGPWPGSLEEVTTEDPKTFVPDVMKFYGYF
jgi:hypothetical protein